MSLEEETEIRNTVEGEFQHSLESIQSDRKCLHESDRTCYNDREKKIIAKIPEESVPSSTESVDDDSIHSGESLFKTFHFDAQDDDPDVERCMNFWKDVLAKNIKPIKCTLINKQKRREEKEPKPINNVKKDPCDKEETQQMWLDIYKDLQRRKLDEIKLVKKKTCDPCEDFFDKTFEKKQDADDIKNLNDWKGQNRPTTRINITAQLKRTLDVLKSHKSSSKDKEKSTGKKIVRDGKSSKSSSLSPTAEESGSEKLSPSRRSSSVSGSKPKTRLSLNDGSFRKSTSEDLLRTSLKNIKSEADNSSVCCKCGCDVEQCICADMDDLGIELKSSKQLPACYPCDCTSVCVCDDHNRDTDFVCSCGCSIEDCICKKYETCKCGCSFDECICEQLDDDCNCGCGLEECICQQLFTKTCKCGHEDCDCDMIEILSAYLDSINTPTVTQSTTETEVVSTQTQTDDKNQWMQTVPKEDFYCIICGHYNCNCTLENPAT